MSESKVQRASNIHGGALSKIPHLRFSHMPKLLRHLTKLFAHTHFSGFVSIFAPYVRKETSANFFFANMRDLGC